jgi:hypothetical protein
VARLGQSVLDDAAKSLEHQRAWSDGLCSVTALVSTRVEVSFKAGLANA